MSDLTMHGVTTDQYRQAAKELFLAMQQDDTTVEQVENGFKCLGLMYLALREHEEFDSAILIDVKRNENAAVLRLASNQRIDWLLLRNLPIVLPVDQAPTDINNVQSLTHGEYNMTTERKEQPTKQPRLTAKQRKQAEEAKAKALLTSVHDLYKPHEHGTVSELATKYGVSKSEIRRRKQAGTLDQLINPTTGDES